MEEEKTSKKTIIVVVVLVFCLIAYLGISKDWFGIKSRYFGGSKFTDFSEIFNFFMNDGDDSDDYSIYWDDDYYGDDYYYDSYDYKSYSNGGYKRENAPDRMVPVVKGKSYYYADDYDNPSLSTVMKEMKLRATYCPYIFCQTANDSGEYVNLKHYYWDENNETMILIPDVYHVSNCSYYDDLFKQGKL